jgi:hypothetical protein
MNKPFKIDLHTFSSGAVRYHADGYITPKTRVELITDLFFPSLELADVRLYGTLDSKYVQRLRRYADGKDPGLGQRPVTFAQRRKVMAMLGKQFMKDFG